MAVARALLTADGICHFEEMERQQTDTLPPLRTIPDVFGWLSGTTTSSASVLLLAGS